MENRDRFAVVGIRPPAPPPPERRAPWHLGRPVLAWIVLGILVFGCLFADFFLSRAPGYMDFLHAAQPPGREFWFGTDTLGRDIFSMIWAGGRTSLAVGFAAAALSAALGLALGALGAMAHGGVDRALNRLVEIFLSVPHLLVVTLLLGVLGNTGAGTLALTLGLTSWTDIAKVVGTEARRLRASGYVTASRAMGGGFFHILRRHLTPGCFSSMMFMAVMNVRNAIAAEASLSFLGLGLPLEAVSWGNMLAMAQQALLGRYWWMIVIPGGFLAAALLCLTEIGNSLRRGRGGRHSYL